VQDDVVGVGGAEGGVGDGRGPVQPRAVQALLLQGATPLRVLLLHQGVLKDLRHGQRKGQTDVKETCGFLHKLFSATKVNPLDGDRAPTRTCWSACTSTRWLPEGWMAMALGQELYTGSVQWYYTHTHTHTHTKTHVSG